LEFKVKIDSDLSIATATAGFQTKMLVTDFDTFLENVCIMQSRELNPSNFVNLAEFNHIKSWINTFSPLMFKEVEGRSEDKTSLSENVGVGLSMCCVEELWGDAEFKKIDRSGKRPDYEAILQNGDRLIIESKGTGSIKKGAVVGAFKKADVQKNVNIGRGYFEKISSITNLLSDRATIVYLVDPPTDKPVKATDEEIMSAKAYTYSKLFSVYGFAELSRYFKLLSERSIQKDFDRALLREKENLFDKIRNQFSYEFDGVMYYGQFRRIENKNTFLGVDERLLYLDTFLTFRETKNKILEDKNKTIRRSKKGFLIIEFASISTSDFNIQSTDILNNYDFLRISDIDEMSDIGFEKYIFYLFENSNFNVKREVKSKRYIHDLVVRDNNGFTYIIEIKKIRKKDYFKVPILTSKFVEKNIQPRINNLDLSKSENFILITNAVSSENMKNIESSNNLIIWDRDILKQIIINKNTVDYFL